MRGSLLVLFLFALGACGGGGDGDPAVDGGTPAVDAAPVCNGHELCVRSLGECGVTSITQEQCEAFYAPGTTTCANIAAYTTCNCECFTEPSCGQYFSCGETCFNTHCGQ